MKKHFFRMSYLKSSLLVTSIFALSFVSAQMIGDVYAQEHDLKTVRIDRMNAVPPKPTYFPDEAHSLNKVNPSSGATPTQEAMIGSMVLEQNAAYSQKDRNTLQRLRDLNASINAEKPAKIEPNKNNDALNLNVMPESPVLSPNAAWLVGPSKASKRSEGDPMGCIALNQFSNDFILGLHASDKNIKGLTIDTRQSVFKIDEVYPVAMSLGDDSYALMALGSSQSTLAVSLDEITSFGHKASQVGVIRLVVGQSPMYFSTAGLSDGLRRLQDCLKTKGASTLKVANSTSGKEVVQALPANADFLSDQAAPKMQRIEPMPIKNPGKNVPISLAVTELIPSGHRFVIEAGVDPMTPVSWDVGSLWFDVLRRSLSSHSLYVAIADKVITISKTPPMKNMDAMQNQVSSDSAVHHNHQRASYNGTRVWEAPAGSSLKTTLYEWALEAGVKPKIDLDQDFVLEQEFFYDGTLQNAVSQLMGRFEGQDGAPRMMMKHEVSMSPMRGNGRHSSNSPRPSSYSDMVGQPAPELERIGYLPSKYYNGRPDMPGLSATTWRALEGSDLETILGRWTDEARIRLVWDMDQVIELKESVKLQGSFTDAVTGVLQQYASDTIRPVAQLNNDPKTKEQVLIIRLAKSGHGKKYENGEYPTPKAKPDN